MNEHSIWNKLVKRRVIKNNTVFDIVSMRKVVRYYPLRLLDEVISDDQRIETFVLAAEDEILERRIFKKKRKKLR
jgi:hypothetical protein